MIGMIYAKIRTSALLLGLVIGLVLPGSPNLQGAQVDDVASGFLSSCQSDGADIRLKKQYKFLANLIAYLAEKNQELFAQSDSIADYCIEVGLSPGTTAWVDYEQKKIVFNSGIFELAKNDAQIAAIVSHELIHVLMKHDERIIPKELVQNQAWYSLYREYATYENSFFPGIVDALRNRENLREERNSIVPKLFSSLASDNEMTSGSLISMQIDSLSEDIDELSGRYHNLCVANKAELANELLFNIFMIEEQGAALSKLEQRVITQSSKANLSDMSLSPLLQRYFQIVDEIAMYEEIIDETTRIRQNYINEISNLAITIRGEEFYAANWVEQEADEMGYQVFLRAGFKPEFYHYYSFLSLNANPNICLPKIAQILAGEDEEIPNRGIGSHPTDCWRLYNLIVRENVEKFDEYKKYFFGNTMENLFLAEEYSLPNIKSSFEYCREEG